MGWRNSKEQNNNVELANDNNNDDDKWPLFNLHIRRCWRCCGCQNEIKRCDIIGLMCRFKMGAQTRWTNNALANPFDAGRQHFSGISIPIQPGTPYSMECVVEDAVEL